MSERNPKRFENGSNAQNRSAEEQRRLMEEYDAARYEETLGSDEDAYNEAMATREFEANAAIEERVMGDASARMMYMMAQRIAELRASGAEPEIITDKEDKLQERLAAYADEAQAARDGEFKMAEMERDTIKGQGIRAEKEAKAEAELAKRLEEVDFIVNSTDSTWASEHGATSKEDTAEAEPVDVDKDRVKDMEEARVLADVEEISRIIKSDPEAAEKSGAYDKLRAILGEIDAALAGAKKTDEEVKEPKDIDVSEDEVKEPKGIDLDDDEEVKTPEDIDLTDDEEVKTPKDIDLGEDDEDVKTPKDVNLDVDKDDDTKELKKVSPWRNPHLAVYAYFASGRGLERFRSSKKGKAVLVLGGLALVGGLIAGRHYGWFGGGGGGSQQGADAFAPGQKGGHPGGTGIETPPITPKVGPEIPNADNYAHPWNWMKAAMENGSITPPKGMSAEQALHYYGEKAAGAGHKVEWYNLPNGLEAVRVDGSDDTKVVGDILGQFAK